MADNNNNNNNNNNKWEITNKYSEEASIFPNPKLIFAWKRLIRASNSSIGGVHNAGSDIFCWAAANFFSIYG